MPRFFLLTTMLLGALGAPAQTATELRPLLDAAARGRAERVSALLETNPGWVSTADDDGETALHRAASHGQTDVVDLLLARGAEVDARSYNNFTPLHRATMHHSIGIVRRLLAKGANVEARTSFDRTPLQIAAEAEQLALAKVLLDHGAFYDLHSATSRDDLKRVRALAALPETRVKFATLQAAVRHGQADIVAILLTIPRADELPPLMAGVRLPLAFYGTAHADVIKALVEGGIDPLERGPLQLSRLAPRSSTVLHHAAGLGHAATLRYLLEGPLAERPDAVDVRDHDGRSPFLRAASAGQIEAMTVLAAHGADPNAVDKNGRTAVHLAAIAGQLDSIEWLVRRGVAALDGVDADGHTALALTASALPWDAAKGADQMRVAELLQRLGSPVGLHAAAVLGDAPRVRALLSRPEYEPTAHMAARAILFDRPKALAAFVDAGLDPNARYWHERTLLHVAVIRNAPNCARWLLEHGADPTLTDAHGKLARQWLNARLSPELRALFE